MRFMPSSLIILFSLSLVSCAKPKQCSNTDVMVLKENWELVAASKVKSSGNDISQPAFNAAGWYKTTVPSTVMAALVKNGVYKDLYVGNNLAKDRKSVV